MHCFFTNPLLFSDSLLETDGEMRVLIEGEDVSGDLRTEEIGMLASSVSAIPAVREALLPLQRSAGREGGIVPRGGIWER